MSYISDLYLGFKQIEMELTLLELTPLYLT